MKPSIIAYLQEQRYAFSTLNSGLRDETPLFPDFASSIKGLSVPSTRAYAMKLRDEFGSESRHLLSVPSTRAYAMKLTGNITVPCFFTLSVPSTRAYAMKPV